MTKKCIVSVFLTLLCLVIFSACQKSTSTPEQSAVNEYANRYPEESQEMEYQIQTPSENEYGIDFFIVPDMTDEQHSYYTDYVQKLLDSGLLRRNWSADEYSSITTEPEDSVENGNYLMLAFKYIIGLDEMRKLSQEYDGEYPAAVIEGILLEHFPFTTSQLHDILFFHYNADTDTYHYEGHPGGGVSDGAVTNVNISETPENQQILISLSYEIYTGYSGLDILPNTYLYKTPGILTLKQNPDGSYVYWAVEVNEKIEAPTAN